MKHWLERFSVVIFALLFYAGMDVAAQPFWKDFADGGLVNHLYSIYYPTWQLSLLGLMILIGVAYRSVVMPLSLYLLGHNGTEDLFFYLIQGQLPPHSLWWIYSNALVFPQPTTDLSLYFGFGWGVLLLAYLSSIETSRRISNLFRLKALEANSKLGSA